MFIEKIQESDGSWYALHLLFVSFIFYFILFFPVFDLSILWNNYSMLVVFDS